MAFTLPRKVNAMCLPASRPLLKLTFQYDLQLLSNGRVARHAAVILGRS